MGGWLGSSRGQGSRLFCTWLGPWKWNSGAEGLVRPPIVLVPARPPTTLTLSGDRLGTAQVGGLGGGCEEQDCGRSQADAGDGADHLLPCCCLVAGVVGRRSVGVVSGGECGGRGQVSKGRGHTRHAGTVSVWRVGRPEAARVLPSRASTGL